jgi:hypothetical protein
MTDNYRKTKNYIKTKSFGKHLLNSKNSEQKSHMKIFLMGDESELQKILNNVLKGLLMCVLEIYYKTLLYIFANINLISSMQNIINFLISFHKTITKRKHIFGRHIHVRKMYVFISMIFIRR